MRLMKSVEGWKNLRSTMCYIRGGSIMVLSSFLYLCRRFNPSNNIIMKELTEEQVKLVEENMCLLRPCALNWATEENYTEHL